MAETAGIAVQFEALVAEGFDIGDALQGFLQHRSAVGQTVLRFPRVTADAFAKKQGDEDQHGKGGNHQPGQPEGSERDQHDAPGHQHDLTQELLNRDRERVLDEGEIVGQPAGQFAHPALGEETHGLADQFGENFPPEIDQGALAGTVKPIGGKKRKAGLEGQRPEQHQRDGIDVAGPVCVGCGFCQRTIQQQSGEIGKTKAERGRDNEGEDGAAEADVVRPEVAENLPGMNERFPRETGPLAGFVRRRRNVVRHVSSWVWHRTTLAGGRS